LANFYNSLDSVHLPGAWLTIGSFDGVHRGHQELIRGLVSGAHAAGEPAVVLTFYPHPSVVLKGIRGPFYLTSPIERAALLSDLGVDGVVTLEFTLKMATLSARDFMQRLKDKLNIHRLWVGNNFALGRGREGDVSALTDLGRELGYQVDVISPVQVDDLLISSTQIRAWLVEGAVDRVNAGLGRWFRLTGRVIHGDGRGKKIGIPTANLDLWEQRALPANGVYAVYGLVDGIRRPGVANIGLRPTFETQPDRPRLEVLLLDYSADFYGQEMSVDFIARLRGEQRFPSVEALLAQIEQDKVEARKALAVEG
jgi:riboflavin kinase/FMN adenylyltransferase